MENTYSSSNTRYPTTCSPNAGQTLFDWRSCDFTRLQSSPSLRGPLEHALAHVQNLHPRRVDIDPLLKTLQSRAHPQRSDLATASEIECWCSTSSGSLLGALHNSFRALVQWSTSGASNAPAPSYTHRQLVVHCAHAGWPNASFDALLDDILKEGAKGTGDIALDVVTALICAPVADNGKGRLSLRNVLSAGFNDSYKLSKKDPCKSGDDSEAVSTGRSARGQVGGPGSE